MSVVGAGMGPGALSDFQRGGALCSEVQCIMGNGIMMTPINRQTDMTENITFPQLRWLAVTNLQIVV